MEINEFIVTLLIVCPLIYLSAFVDAIAGGGGLISLPAYLLAGLPTHMALGTNQVVSGAGGFTATIQYLKKGKLHIKIAIVSSIGAMFGAMGGSKMALFIPEKILSVIILIVLPLVAIFLITQKNFGNDDCVMKEFSMIRQSTYAALIGLFIGFYDGLIGPGTGTFMIICFTKVFNLDLVSSSGCAKMSNLASNIAATLVFMFAGQIMWSIVLPAAICGWIGGNNGAKYALKSGSERIRKYIFVVIGLLFVKVIFDIF